MSIESERHERTTLEFLPSPATQRQELALHIVHGPRQGEVFLVDKPYMLLGRGEDADIRIQDPTLSRHHVRFERSGSHVRVVDLGSRNGTYVGPTRLGRDKCLLRSGEVLTMGNIQVRFSAEDARFIDVSRALYEAAVRDHLTGLYNRGHFEERLVTEVRWARRSLMPLALLVIDLDHFKQVNDRFGHPIGDAVLRMTSAAIARSVRSEDVAARLGGEEFVVLARGADEHGAQVLAQRLRTNIAASHLELARELRVTASIGVAVLEPHRDYADGPSLFAAADEALYLAKRAGRDRVLLHRPTACTSQASCTGESSMLRPSKPSIGQLCVDLLEV